MAQYTILVIIKALHILFPGWPVQSDTKHPNVLQLMCGNYSYTSIHHCHNNNDIETVLFNFGREINKKMQYVV